MPILTCTEQTRETTSVTFYMRTTADRPPERPYRGNVGIDIFAEGNHHTEDACISLLPGVPTRITTAIQAKIPDGIYLKVATRSPQAA
eukprot:TCALIF_13552-PA protein Name:"Protein of unknown function" AED:0.30 eAED:0.30 QI:0/0/0/0.5/1/1/2/0/87